MSFRYEMAALDSIVWFLVMQIATRLVRESSPMEYKEASAEDDKTLAEWARRTFMSTFFDSANYTWILEFILTAKNCLESSDTRSTYVANINWILNTSFNQ